MGRTQISTAILNDFLSNLSTVSEQRGYEFVPGKIGGRQIYPLNTANKLYFVFILVSSIEEGFWNLGLKFQEDLEKLCSARADSDWAIILLRKPTGKHYPLGFLITRSEFLEMKSHLSIDSKGWVKIHEKDLALSAEFYNWDTFFQLLKL